MKISIDIDCTPEEARTFLGLPDVKPMQDSLMQEVESRMKANIDAMDPETMWKTWLPAGMQNVGDLQKAFWSQFMQGGGRKSEGEDG